MEPDVRVQGTDGIRRPTALDDGPQVQGLSPLDAFLKAGLITPGFMELYAYCFVKDLRRLGGFKEGGSVVVGWDPRDPGAKFIQAFIAGARKAHAEVLSVGIVPTPAVPLYMLYCGACGAAMITASHNLKDQNGVKLFFGDHGLKYLPGDDERLTSLVFEVSRDVDLKNLRPIREVVDRHDEAIDVFERFSFYY